MGCQKTWLSVFALVVLVAFGSACAGWTYGPAWPAGTGRTIGQPVSVPSVDEGQRFDLFLIGAIGLPLSWLLLHMPIGLATDDWTFNIPLAGPYIQWESHLDCPEGTSCFGVLFNVFGVVATACEVASLVLFLYGLFSEPEE